MQRCTTLNIASMKCLNECHSICLHKSDKKSKKQTNKQTNKKKIETGMKTKAQGHVTPSVSHQSVRGPLILCSGMITSPS